MCVITLVPIHTLEAITTLEWMAVQMVVNLSRASEEQVVYYRQRRTVNKFDITIHSRSLTELNVVEVFNLPAVSHKHAATRERS